ncbi:hypothetical protein C8R46DRAFT_1278180 [Mycena filopes]|nr:hypothetical protein C8R46DRAFT_1278180 [Mycena filopes]
MRFDELRKELARIEVELALAKLQLDSIVYPVLTLPGEITSAIFLKCVESEVPFGFQRNEWGDRYRMTSLATEAPLLLLQICKSWRSIALGTPALWANLSSGHSFEADDPATVVSPNTLEQGIDRWLRRAAAVPVSLSLFGANGSANCNTTEMWLKSVRNLLRAHALRLRSLSLVYNLDVSALGESLHFPILHSLTVNYASSDAVIDTFHDSPQLREVYFVSAESPILSHQITLPWHQLAVFRANELPISDCLQILRWCPCLKSLTLALIPNPEPSARPLVVHQSLEQLSISHLSGALTHLLDLPALRSLTLHEVTLDGPAFLAFLRRSSCSLRVFTYNHNAQSGVSAIALDWFRIAEGLREVTLAGLQPAFIHALLSALDRAENPKFLPQLYRLELSTTRFPVNGPISERETNVGSEANGATLESLKLVVPPNNHDLPWDELGPIDWDALYNLGTDGMDIYAGSDKENFLWEWC